MVSSEDGLTSMKSGAMDFGWFDVTQLLVAWQGNVSKVNYCEENFESKRWATERTIDEPPFTKCGSDMFCPSLIKEGRKEIKRYGTLFTCLCSRSVHIQCIYKLETDSFIQALRQFTARRGNIRVLSSDNGSNFVGTPKELENAYSEIDHWKIQFFFQNQGADYINWHRNPPPPSPLLPPSASSHVGKFGKNKFDRHV